MSETIQISVRCFSHVRHQLGKEQLELSLPPGSTVADAEHRVRDLLGPATRNQPFRLALNKDFVDSDAPLREGDEVAILPPMQGG